MKRIIAILLMMAMLMPTSIYAGESTKEVLVVFENKTTDEEIEEITEDVKIEEEIKNIVVVEGTESEITQIENEEKVKTVQPNYKYKLMDDPLAKDAVQLKNINYSKAEENLSKTPKKVTIAVIDTGADFGHEDLACLNKSKAKSTTGDELAPLDGDVSSASHGTHVCGIIGATADNGKGTAGIATGLLGNKNVEIIPIGIFEQTEEGLIGYSSSVIEALYYAKDCNVDVINMSIGISGYDEAVETAMQSCKKAGITMVSAGGNENTSDLAYPSDSDAGIGVINLQFNNKRNPSSNYGDKKDISAPGTFIKSTIKNGYGSKSGTSMAAPVVSACVAAAYSLDESMTPDKARDLICETATDLETAGFDNETAYGCVNLEGIVNKLCNIKKEITLSESSYTYDGKQKTPTVTVKDMKGNIIDSSEYEVTYQSGRTNAGIYDVTVEGDWGKETIKFEITKAPVEVSEQNVSCEFLTIAQNIPLNKEYYWDTPTEYITKNCQKTIYKKATDNNHYDTATKANITINPKDITKMTFDIGTTKYDGTQKTPTIKVSYNTYTAKQGTDYEVEYSGDRISVGIYKIKFKGKGNLTGEAELYFNINKATPKEIPDVEVECKYGEKLKSIALPEGFTWYNPETTVEADGEFTAIYHTGDKNYEDVNVPIFVKCKGFKKITRAYTSNLIYTGKAQTPKLSVYSDGGKVPESDYTVSYKNNVNAGRASFTVIGLHGYTGQLSGGFNIYAKPISASQVYVAPRVIYTGKTINPVSVNASHYVNGLSAQIGPHSITIVMNGNYTGTVSGKYTIIPQSPNYNYNKKSGKYRKVKWTKENATRYQIKYSNYKNFRKSKTKTLKGTYAKVKGKYVKIRCYKTVGRTKYYSSWR